MLHINADTGLHALRVQLAGATVLRVLNNGGTSLGTNNTTTTPANGLYVHWDILYNGSHTITSDRRYKKYITSINGALDALSNIDGVRYLCNRAKYPDKRFSDEPQIGFIAQNVEKEFQELVKTDSEGYKSVDYSKMTLILVEAINELSRRNSEHEVRLALHKHVIERMIKEDHNQ